MESIKIREAVSPMVIWMADAAIRKACSAINDSNLKLPHPYNRIDGESEVLFRMFDICAADAKNALMELADGHSGYSEYLNFNYFDSFVEKLNEMIEDGARLRAPDWVLDRV